MKTFVLVKKSLKFVPLRAISYMRPLPQIMAGCQPGQNSIWTIEDIVYWRIYASLCLTEFN